MSAPIRFLGIAILAYVGLRTAGSALALEPIALRPAVADAGKAASAQARAALPPPGVPADMGPAPYATGGYPGGGYPGATPYPYPPMLPAGVVMTPQGYAVMPYGAMPMAAAAAGGGRTQVVYVPAPYPVGTARRGGGGRGDDGGWDAPQRSAGAPPIDAVASGYDSPVPPLSEWASLGSTLPGRRPAIQQTPDWNGDGSGADDGEPLKAARPRRWSVDAWALMRAPGERTLGFNDPGRGLNPGLASAGSLGGSQAGMRITWKPLPAVGVHLRASAAMLSASRSSQTLSGGEGALGLSWQPFRQVPVRLLAERRQRLGPAEGGGRNDFAFLLEGGLYDRRLPFGVRLDGYGQAGMVGVKTRDLFADGALTATYPFLPRFAIGAGMWGGLQPGLSRFDAGPRLSYQLKPGIRAHLDYRFRLRGNADPGSGPALTIAAGF